MLFDFWKALPSQQCVHPEDRKILAKHPRIFELGIPPGHVSGRLKTAPVVACYLNPSFKEADRVYFSRETEEECSLSRLTEKAISRFASSRGANGSCSVCAASR